MHVNRSNQRHFSRMSSQTDYSLSCDDRLYVQPSQVARNAKDKTEQQSPEYPPKVYGESPTDQTITPARHLVLDYIDEEHRNSKKTAGPGYCVDELCTCSRHKCMQENPPLPFTHTSLYRDEYKAKPIPPLPTEPMQVATYDANGVPIGMDPLVFHSYINEHGKPANNEYPARLFRLSTPETRDFYTENRCAYAFHPTVLQQQDKVYGVNDIPPGINVKAWKEFVEKNGPTQLHNIPSYLYYTYVPDTRDFSTESRSRYVNLSSQMPRNVSLRDNPPPNVDLKQWNDLLDKYGDNINMTTAMQLLYKRDPDTRDFSTDYKKNYVAYQQNRCPLTTLPPYPTVMWPRKHTFWDPVAKQWY